MAIRTRLGLPLRRRRIAGVGCVHPAAAVLRHPRQAHQRAVGGRRRARVVGLSRSGRQLRPLPAPAALSSRCAITSCCSIRAPRRSTDLTRPGGRTADQPPQRRQGRAGRLLLGRQHGREHAAPEDRRAVSRHAGRPDRAQGGGLCGVQRSRVVARRPRHVPLGFHGRHHRGLGLRCPHRRHWPTTASWRR